MLFDARSFGKIVSAFALFLFLQLWIPYEGKGSRGLDHESTGTCDQEAYLQHTPYYGD